MISDKLLEENRSQQLLHLAAVSLQPWWLAEWLLCIHKHIPTSQPHTSLLARALLAARGDASDGEWFVRSGGGLWEHTHVHPPAAS